VNAGTFVFRNLLSMHLATTGVLSRASGPLSTIAD
jgi:hypothetical protein